MEEVHLVSVMHMTFMWENVVHILCEDQCQQARLMGDRRTFYFYFINLIIINLFFSFLDFCPTLQLVIHSFVLFV